MDNKTLWDAVLAAWHVLQHDFHVEPLQMPPYGGTPTRTLWGEHDMVFRFTHYLVTHGQIPLDWLHMEASMSDRSDDPSNKKLDSGRRVDLVIADLTRLPSTPTTFYDWQGQLFFEAKIVFTENKHPAYSYLAVEKDAAKLQRHVGLRRADGGVILIYSRQKGSGYAPWYHQLVGNKGLGALVHFENCPSEDIEFAPPGF